MATHLSQDPEVEPDVTERGKLRAAADFLLAAERGDVELNEALATALGLVGAVLRHEAERGRP